MSFQDVSPFNRHCMVPVTEAAEPFGAPTARMFTTPCVITVAFGVVNDRFGVSWMVVAPQ